MSTILLTQVPKNLIYIMSMFELLKGVAKQFDIFIKRLFWYDKEDYNKYHLVRLENVYQPVDQGARDC